MSESASNNEPDSKQCPIQHSLCRLLYTDCHWKCFLLTVLLCGCLSAIAWCKVSLQDHRGSLPSTAVSIFDQPHRGGHGGSSDGGGGSSPSGGSTGPSGPVYACEDSYVYIPIAFVVVIYIVYLVECWHCRIRLQLLGCVDARTVYDHIRSLREALPIVWWKAVCYHYVRRSRQVARYRNGDAFTSTQVYYERVNSHVGTAAFDYADCGVKDISKRLTDLEKFPSAKIRFTKRFSFATQEAEREFEQQRDTFFSSYERRDDYIETREGVDFLNVNFREQMVVFADPHRLPWYVSGGVFWAASVLLLSWPIRVLIQYKTAYVHYYVHKVFGCNYLDVRSRRGSRSMVREDTMESNELEMSIQSNYVLVPSYSEALLMECTEELHADPSSLRPRTESSSGQALVTAATPVFAAVSGGLRTYGTVAMVTRNVALPSRVTTTTMTRRHRDPVCSRVENGELAGYPRRLRRSYYEAICLGNGSSLTLDRQSRRSLVSLVIGTTRKRPAIIASVSSPDSIAQTNPVRQDDSLTSTGNRDTGNFPGSWNALPPLESADPVPVAMGTSETGSSREDGICIMELPPSYEMALNMEQVKVVGGDLLRDFDDDISISTTSTYIPDSVHATPRHIQSKGPKRKSSSTDDGLTFGSVETTI